MVMVLVFAPCVITCVFSGGEIGGRDIGSKGILLLLILSNTAGTAATAAVYSIYASR